MCGNVVQTKNAVFFGILKKTTVSATLRRSAITGQTPFCGSENISKGVY